MINIVIIGPESTGKSTLCSQLAVQYKTRWVPEYAREFLLKNGTDYSYHDLLTIARGQIDLEELMKDQLNASHNEVAAAQANEENSFLAASKVPLILFMDTDMYVMKVWCEYVFDKCHSWILNRIAERSYDCYLLCNPDLDWVADELREYPDKLHREQLYHHFKDLMINQHVPWVDISGSYEERFLKATTFIDYTFPNVLYH